MEKEKKGLKKKERAPFSQEKKKILAAMRSLSIQSLMISVTAAFSRLLALRWSDYIIHFYSWVQIMHRSSFQDDSQT